jgi:hypothetical protein
MSKMGQYIQEFNDDLINMSFHDFCLKHANDYPNKAKDENKLKELKDEYNSMKDDLLTSYEL